MPASDIHVAAPAAIGVNVLRFAPLGPVQLTQPQREEILRELDACKRRIADLGLALGDNAGWFDRAMAAERERDAAKAMAGELAERLESLLIATAPGLTTHLDHEKDEARALLSRTRAGCLAQRPGHG